MEQTAIIFIGRSGCGKGTQATLMAEYLNRNSDSEVIYIQSGSELRTFIKGDGFTEKFAKDIFENGDLEPEFLMIYLWVSILIRQYKGKEHIIIDGTPRRVHEAGVLHSMFQFYKIVQPFVVYLNVDKEASIKRLLARGRKDDNKEDIAERLSWFEADVIPTIEFYRKNAEYRFIEIAADRPMEEVHLDILEGMKAFRKS